jgi:hypothetical protein
VTTKEEDYLQTNSEGQVSACPSSPFIIHYTVLSAVLVTIHLKAFQLPPIPDWQVGYASAYKQAFGFMFFCLCGKQ